MMLNKTKTVEIKVPKYNIYYMCIDPDCLQSPAGSS